MDSAAAPASEFEILLRQAMGLDAASIGASAIERAVQERRQACGIGTAQAYLDFLRGSGTELQELIEAVVVPETWFFRDFEAFTALALLMHKEHLRSAAPRQLRLLSLPCSTGEEPYSMAMALLDAGLPPERFRIDAVDISARALEQARQAVYRKNSFRGAELGFRERYFEPYDRGHRMCQAVRAQVTFQQGNLFAGGFLPGSELYDAIFCRNVLIYFDRSGQRRAIEVLTRVLKADGALFVAPAETGLVQSQGFVPLKMPMAFAFRKGGAADSRALRPPPPRAAAPAPPPRFNLNPARPPAPPAAPVRPHAPPPAPAAASGRIEEAARLADQGRLTEAAKACEAHLREHGPSAEVLHLLGLVRDAGGEAAEAARYYRQALYLEPNHEGALVHLALLLERQGDRAAAEVMRGRLRRLQQAADR